MPWENGRKRRYSDHMPMQDPYRGPREFMEAGVRGFLVTCIPDREEHAIDEAVKVLRKSCIKLYGGIRPLRREDASFAKGYVMVDFMDPEAVIPLPHPEPEKALAESNEVKEKEKETKDADKPKRQRGSRGGVRVRMNRERREQGLGPLRYTVKKNAPTEDGKENEEMEQEQKAEEEEKDEVKEEMGEEKEKAEPTEEVKEENREEEEEKAEPTEEVKEENGEEEEEKAETTEEVKEEEEPKVEEGMDDTNTKEEKESEGTDDPKTKEEKEKEGTDDPKTKEEKEKEEKKKKEEELRQKKKEEEEKLKPPLMLAPHKFNSFRTELRNIMFVKADLADPTLVATTVFDLIMDHKPLLTGCINQLLPVHGVCENDYKQFEIMCRRVLVPFIGEHLEEAPSFGVLLVDKMSEPGSDILLEVVRSAIWCLNPLAYQCSPWSEPDVVIHIEIIGSKIILCAMKKYMKYRQYSPFACYEMGEGKPEEEEDILKRGVPEEKERDKHKESGDNKGRKKRERDTKSSKEESKSKKKQAGETKQEKVSKKSEDDKEITGDKEEEKKEIEEPTETEPETVEEKKDDDTTSTSVEKRPRRTSSEKSKS